MTHPCQPMVALIPARGGSSRVPGKNVRCLNGHPVIVYTIAAAQQSGVFARIVVCTDDVDIIRIAYYAGAQWIERAPVSGDQRDVEWVAEALDTIRPRMRSFAILRPTSPFRTADTIRRAYDAFTLADQTADSIRAVELVRQHPGKMWTCEGMGYPLKPLLDRTHPDGTPWHSSPTQSLPPVYVQNSSLDMAWTANVEVHGSIAGRKIAPFYTEQFEGVSIDHPEDWARAEQIARDHPDALPPVDVARVSAATAS